MIKAKAAQKETPEKDAAEEQEQKKLAEDFFKKCVQDDGAFLAAGGYEGDIDTALKYIAEHCKDLQVIVLEETGVTDVGLKYIADNCKNLKSILLNGTKVTDVGLKYIVDISDTLG